MTTKMTSQRVFALTGRRGLCVSSKTPQLGAVRSIRTPPALATQVVSLRCNAQGSPTTQALPRPIQVQRNSSTQPAVYTSSTARAYSTDPVPTSSTWTPPADPYVRPVVVVGIGNMGRRLAVMWASTSRPVIIYDHSRQALDEGLRYIGDTLGYVCSHNGGHPGKVTSTTNLREACDNSPWMVIEALPELLDLKTEVLGEVDGLIPDDCILATNSSSFKSRELAGRVHHKERLVNTHHYIPPRNICVEIMTCGSTDPKIMPFLADQMVDVGLRPIIVPTESQGYIFNRIWAAAKRETLKVLSEGVGKADDVDALFRDFFHAEKGPCERMDEVGLDTIRRIEEHYLNLKGVPEDKRPWLDWLEKEYIARGDLGEKSGEGIFTQARRKELAAERKRQKKKAVEEYRGA
ncbi:3-hydroxyacyl-dehydrogenase [Zalerion maritima]|uniref:3-hydroxyacyl-dehydrogenase n=1 Tax=Zalerion maritima TaxID=339359 RepID=A0AAD5RR19_9PEZI|nr:3-hydroxyacyl-dehydrogenase [Zalerion maritima]